MFLKRKMQMKKEIKSLKVTETFLSKNSKVAWASSDSDSNQGSTAQSNIFRMNPGSTRSSAAHVQGIPSTFILFVTPAIGIILEITSFEVSKNKGKNGKHG